MPLKTLKDLKEIGGFKIWNQDDLAAVMTPDQAKKYENTHPIMIDNNTISFRIQDGPIRETGVNGCQVDTLLHAAIKIIAGLNIDFPCDENGLAIDDISSAIYWLDTRKKIREARGVEGTSQP